MGCERVPGVPSREMQGTHLRAEPLRDTALVLAAWVLP